MKPIWKRKSFWISVILLIVTGARIFYLEIVGTLDYLALFMAAVFFVYLRWKYGPEEKNS